MTQPVTPFAQMMQQAGVPARAAPPAGPPAGWPGQAPAAPQGWPGQAPVVPGGPPPQPTWPQQPQAPVGPPPGWGPPQQSQAAPEPVTDGPDYGDVSFNRDKHPKIIAGASYLLEIEETEEIRIPNVSRTWRAQVKVLEANPPLMPVGSTAVLLQSLTSETSRGIGYSEIKKFTAAAYGAPSEEVFNRLPNWKYLCAATHNKAKQLNPYFPANPLKGLKIRVTVAPTGKTDDAGQDYGKNTYFPA